MDNIYTEDKKSDTGAVLNRISRIEGQLNGVRKMVENTNACSDIITQVLAIREAVSSLGVEILKNDFICKKYADELDEKTLKNIFKLQ